MTDKRIRFQAGTVVATIGATMVATTEQIRAMVARHLSGDWGDLDESDKKANDDAVKWGDRILSSYHINGEKLWVETTADRESTCVMTPGEY
jgi:hypothetical protein